MIDTFLKGLEQTKIKIIAGDLPQGMWEVEGSILQQVATQTSERIDLSKEVSKIELKSQIRKDPYEPFVGAGVGALVGLRMFGLLGAAGGAIAGHYFMAGRPEVSVNIDFKDGRACMAVMSPSMFETVKFLTNK